MMDSGFVKIVAGCFIGAVFIGIGGMAGSLFPGWMGLYAFAGFGGIGIIVLGYCALRIKREIIDPQPAQA